MTSPSNNIILRRLTLFPFPPAFILLLAHGLASEQAFPALGILPLAASAVLALFILNRDVVAALGSPVQALSESNVFWADVLLAALHLGFLIPSWILLIQPWRREQIVLGTYGTVFMMLDLGVHLWIALPQVIHLIASRNCSCPHCRSAAKTGYFSSNVSEYTPLSDGDGDADPEIVSRDLEEGTGNVHL
ncbi:hypothetical protein CCHL11_02718 [Colletotrichum chlorophyti]|uniref:Uncharacterized protein n=1 Tax=Colletotrichum chlorophyti TaxID=708187 RepID=A0A1Q8S2W8_9PEZI|nr:hypothetical protein CCHL11_02718 [Colletotrichum chlorophyti]